MVDYVKQYNDKVMSENRHLLDYVATYDSEHKCWELEKNDEMIFIYEEYDGREYKALKLFIKSARENGFAYNDSIYDLEMLKMII